MQRLSMMKVARLIQPFAQKSRPNILASFGNILQGPTLCPTNLTNIFKTASNTLT